MAATVMAAAMYAMQRFMRALPSLVAGNTKDCAGKDNG
jgi:hypothetical protein